MGHGFHSYVSSEGSPHKPWLCPLHHPSGWKLNVTGTGFAPPKSQGDWVAWGAESGDFPWHTVKSPEAVYIYIP